MKNGGISHWMSSRGADPSRPNPGREPLTDSVTADVVIIGAGFSGLWTAFHLAQARQDLSIVVIERDIVGFGASGRNAGWLSPLVPGNRRVYAAAAGGHEAGVRLQRRMLEAVDEVLAIISDEQIDAHAIRSGNLVIARTPAAMNRLRERLSADRSWGFGADEGWELTRDEAISRINVAGAVGGLFYPGVARIDPAGLLLGLAQRVESCGVRIFEHTLAVAVEPSIVRTDRGEVRARIILRCAEGYTGSIGRDARRIIPVNSSIVITEPIPDEIWARIGWDGYELFGDAAHVFSYSQRTDDGRILLGGRGNPYRYGSGTGGCGRTDHRTIRALTARLHSMFPAAATIPIAHAWSGVLGVTRDWCATVAFDRDSGFGHAQGYAGHGVTSTYLAAKTLAAAVNGDEDGDATLAWRDHRARLWEPEPLRWLGIHAMYRLFAYADWSEERSHATKTSVLARVGGRLAGLHE